MDQPGLDGRPRDKDGEISGPSFAPGAQPHGKLSDVLAEMDGPSLSRLVHDHEHGHLERTIGEARSPTGAAP